MLLEERIHPAPPTSTDLTHDPAGRGSSSRRRQQSPRRRGLHELTSRRRGQVGTRGGMKGRLIRHAGFQALAVLSLPVAMIGASIGSLLVTAVGFPALEATGFFTTSRAAILLATITVRAEVEHRAAGRKVTHALAKDRGTCNRHRFREGALDNRRRSWQDDSRSRTWRSLDRGHQ